ncbi:TerC family protein [Gallionella capsiferriformans]|uniref:Integral membrane protein TerC n=1 Tax=Gallionella capsiferriformans (strain ES-2) TaxID=395494 RepID=D9SCH6_GALCS|nr:TerC family protein [Gallionella capsiferriformans]ADL56557.1 Integral membrane protein TerC [Gallionella capsiferriformans ES-2]
MLEMFATTSFWVDVLKIIMIDILLSGDNAVVIALACRNLPAAQRKKGIWFGMAGAVGLRIVLTFFAVSLLALPYLKLVGAFLLIWIGIKLILPEDEHDEGNIKADARLMGAVKTIIIADFVMSLDNVLGVAAAAKGNVSLLVFGLLISIPLIAWSSQLVLKLIDRFPYIIYGGGALLGYVAGEMLVTEALFATIVEARHYLHWLVPGVCALLVLLIGKWLALRQMSDIKAVDLLDGNSVMPDQKG